ncbi:MAG: hypothetical protein ABW185_16210 [Sedimenticola sp.]
MEWCSRAKGAVEQVESDCLALWRCRIGIETFAKSLLSAVLLWSPLVDFKVQFRAPVRG